MSSTVESRRAPAHNDLLPIYSDYCMTTPKKRSASSAAKAKKAVDKQLSDDQSTPKKSIKPTTTKKAASKKSVVKKTTAKSVTTKKTSTAKKSTAAKKMPRTGEITTSKTKLRSVFSTDITKGNHLVIVESPAKARTIGGYLGKFVDVQASF